MRLSAHFIRNWKRRVGGEPTELLVREIINRSVIVQGCREFTLADGNSYKRLALYWHPEMDLILMVDEISRTAVSLLSRENWKGTCETGKA